MSIQQKSLPDLHDGDDLLFDPCELLLQTLSLFLIDPFDFFYSLLQLNLQLFSGLLGLLSYTQRTFKFFKCYDKKQDKHEKYIVTILKDIMPVHIQKWITLT